jgi:phosphoribosyl 1,2-cyclic phosphodiesterase
MFRVRFWGVRGSIPTPGPSTVQVGGNTSCVEIRAGDRLIILDGGTGLRLLGQDLLRHPPGAASIFFSHVHWDHIQGFPFFAPAFVPGYRFDVHGGRNLSSTLSETLAGQMNFPNFPVTLDQMAATIAFHLFDDGQIVDIGGGVTVRGLMLNHPDGVYGYRIQLGDSAVAYCTDTEHRDAPDEHVLELAEGAELLIYDAQYLPDEYDPGDGSPGKRGWGHSTYVEGARLAKLAGARRLVLFHHDPAHDDETVAEMERRCRELFPPSEAAREGLVIEVRS